MTGSPSNQYISDCDPTQQQLCGLAPGHFLGSSPISREGSWPDGRVRPVAALEPDYRTDNPTSASLDSGHPIIPQPFHVPCPAAPHIASSTTLRRSDVFDRESHRIENRCFRRGSMLRAGEDLAHFRIDRYLREDHVTRLFEHCLARQSVERVQTWGSRREFHRSGEYTTPYRLIPTSPTGQWMLADATSAHE